MKFKFKITRIILPNKSIFFYYYIDKITAGLKHLGKRGLDMRSWKEVR